MAAAKLGLLTIRVLAVADLVETGAMQYHKGQLKGAVALPTAVQEVLLVEQLTAPCHLVVSVVVALDVFKVAVAGAMVVVQVETLITLAEEVAGLIIMA
jgi:hypothetical protein